jgi:hypothetical protein
VVALDGMILQRVHGTKYQIGYVAPGRHSVSIRAEVEGKRVEASELVTVEPGAIAKATLALPIQVAQPA